MLVVMCGLWVLATLEFRFNFHRIGDVRTFIGINFGCYLLNGIVPNSNLKDNRYFWEGIYFCESIDNKIKFFNIVL